MHKRMLVLMLILVVPWLMACGGGQAEANQTEIQAEMLQETVSVVLNDIYFGPSNDNPANPPVWTVNSGYEVTVSFKNNGALEHNWAILKRNEALDVPYDEANHKALLLVEATKVPANSSAEFTFTAPAPGEYQIICTIPGHSMLMRGLLIVQ